jgi:signal transduction histidine kinase
LSDVQLVPVVNLAVSMLSVNIEQKIDAQVPRNLWVRGDPLRMRQVISNLLDNAAKYSPPDSTLSLTCAACTLSQVPLLPDQLNPVSLVDGNPDPPVVLLRVYDQGEGIHPNDQEKIFDKFFRLPRSLTTPVRGSGLGLYISRRYIEAMGGKLWLEQSIPGEGSVFTFYLPRIEAPEVNTQDESIETEFETV